jgi:Zn-dependent M28 family amino/carboxypeptidase
VGYRPGDSSDELVAIGAHYDHLGVKNGVLHPGADDNASGTSVMLEVARAASRSHFRRGVLCFWFDGEEEQLAGSTWWVAHPTLPLSRVAAMLNADMVGRNETEKLFCGVEKDAKGEPKWPKWAALAHGVESRFGAAWNWTEFDPYLRRSDHWPFMAAGIPALFLTGGLHADYHQAGDRLEKINFAKEERVARIVYALLRDAADAPGPLK